MDGVANRYAIALLSIAKEENKVLEYIEEIEQISSVLKDNPSYITLLKNYGLTNDEKKQLLKDCFENKIKEYILNLFYVMVDNKRGGYILSACNEFVRIGLKELSIRRGIVYTTIPLNENELLSMSKKASKMLNANVTLYNKIDKDILGGFKIQVDDYIIDDSLKNRLEKLKETISLKKGENE